jgi:hypothetical protein
MMAGHVAEHVDESRRQQLLSCLSALAANESQRWSNSCSAEPNQTHHHLTYWDSSDREAMADTRQAKPKKY